MESREQVGEMEGDTDSSPAPLVVVTGCDRGVGLWVAQAAHQWGYKVLAGVLDTAGPGAQHLLGVGVQLLELDVTNEKHVARLLDTVTDLEGQGAALYGVINNAGVLAYAPLEWQAGPLAARQLGVNLVGLVGVTGTLLPLLRRNRGRVINIGSPQGLVGTPNMAAYCASKWGVEGFSQALRREVGGWGVSVVVVRPCNLPHKTGILQENARHLQEMEGRLHPYTAADQGHQLLEMMEQFRASYSKPGELIQKRDPENFIRKKDSESLIKKRKPENQIQNRERELHIEKGNPENQMRKIEPGNLTSKHESENQPPKHQVSYPENCDQSTCMEEEFSESFQQNFSPAHHLSQERGIRAQPQPQRSQDEDPSHQNACMLQDNHVQTRIERCLVAELEQNKIQYKENVSPQAKRAQSDEIETLSKDGSHNLEEKQLRQNQPSMDVLMEDAVMVPRYFENEVAENEHNLDKTFTTLVEDGYQGGFVTRERLSSRNEVEDRPGSAVSAIVLTEMLLGGNKVNDGKVNDVSSPDITASKVNNGNKIDRSITTEASSVDTSDTIVNKGNKIVTSNTVTAIFSLDTGDPTTSNGSELDPDMIPAKDALKLDTSETKVIEEFCNEETVMDNRNEAMSVTENCTSKTKNEKRSSFAKNEIVLKDEQGQNQNGLAASDEFEKCYFGSGIEPRKDWKFKEGLKESNVLDDRVETEMNVEASRTLGDENLLSVRGNHNANDERKTHAGRCHCGEKNPEPNMSIHNTQCPLHKKLVQTKEKQGRGAEEEGENCESERSCSSFEGNFDARPGDPLLLQCIKEALGAPSPRRSYTAAPPLVRAYLLLLQVVPEPLVDWLLASGIHNTVLNLARP